MYFTQSLLLGASCLLAFAQAQIAFTKLPASVTAGQPTTLEWSGGDGSAVTITLRQGDPKDLKTVQVITTDASGNSFTWDPPADLPSGDDYAFQISQGQSDVNFSGPFTFTGGSAAVSSVSEQASSATAVSASSVVSVSRTSASAASITSAASASVSSLVSSLLSVVNSRSSRPVVTTVIPGNITTLPVGTGAVGSGITSAISRNTTLSRATLSTPRTVTTTTSVALTLTTARTTGTAGSSSGASESSATGSPSGNSATSMASPLAFVISAFVAIMYLG